MSPLLKDFLKKRITIITTEGNCVVATLEGYDKNTNLVLSDVVDRTLQKTTSIRLLRGSEVVVCGLVEPEENEAEEVTEGHQDKKRRSNELPILKDTKNKVKNEHIIWEKICENDSVEI